MNIPPYRVLPLPRNVVDYAFHGTSATFSGTSPAVTHVARPPYGQYGTSGTYTAGPFYSFDSGTHALTAAQVRAQYEAERLVDAEPVGELTWNFADFVAGKRNYTDPESVKGGSPWTIAYEGFGLGIEQPLSAAYEGSAEGFLKVYKTVKELEVASAKLSVDFSEANMASPAYVDIYVGSTFVATVAAGGGSGSSAQVDIPLEPYDDPDVLGAAVILVAFKSYENVSLLTEIINLNFDVSVHA